MCQSYMYIAVLNFDLLLLINYKKMLQMQLNVERYLFPSVYNPSILEIRDINTKNYTKC